MACLALAVLALVGCESNYARNERAAREGRRLMASAGKVTLGAPNRDIKVRRALVVSGSGAVAAVVQLRNEGTRAQAAVPVLIDVRGAGGASVYRNDVRGLQPALQHAALVPAGRSVWWVNDQLLGVTAAHALTARVGRGTPVGAVAPIKLGGVELGDDGFLTGTITNGSDALERDVPVFAVALRGRRVVAAGRALVPKARPHTPARFRLLFIGNPKGARLQLTVAPTSSAKGPTS